MSGEFREVYFHRLRYFLTPQFEMYNAVREKIGDRLPIGADVLDYGCGNGVGTVLLKLDEMTVFGIDSDVEAIAFALDSWGHLCGFRHQDWTYADFNPARSGYSWLFDLAVCLEVIEHVENPKLLLDNLKSAMKPVHGNVVISTLNHNSQYRKNRGHVGKFCVADFRELVQSVFPDARIWNYDLTEELDDDSTLTPMVATWGPDTPK